MLIISFKSTDKTTQQIYKQFLKTLFTNFKSLLLIQNKKLSINFINLPNKLNRISLLRSPHVNKKAFEQFQYYQFHMQSSVLSSWYCHLH